VTEIFIVLVMKKFILFVYNFSFLQKYIGRVICQVAKRGILINAEVASITELTHICDRKR
jgi:hypothetical protein